MTRLRMTSQPHGYLDVLGRALSFCDLTGSGNKVYLLNDYVPIASAALTRPITCPSV